MISFCSICENLCIPKLVNDNLKYVCEHCTHIENIENEEQLIVSTLQINQTDINEYFKHEINSYTKHDPALPRTSKIPCPNKTCSSNKPNHSSREVVMIRYNEEEFKYMFICAICDTIWDGLGALKY